MLQVFLHLTVSVYNTFYNLHCKQCKTTKLSYIITLYYLHCSARAAQDV